MSGGKDNLHTPLFLGFEPRVRNRGIRCICRRRKVIRKRWRAAVNELIDLQEDVFRKTDLMMRLAQGGANATE